MAEEHFCGEHRIAFRKYTKGDNTWYSHKLADGSYCNEPKEETEKTSRTKKPQQGMDRTKETPVRELYERQSSIEAQNAYTGIITLLANKALDSASPLAQTAFSYAMSKLGRWSSVGGAIDEASSVDNSLLKGGVAERLATAEQITKIKTTAKEKGYSPELAISVMTRLWHKQSSKALTQREADEFIEVIKQGKYLPEEKELEDLSF